MAFRRTNLVRAKSDRQVIWIGLSLSFNLAGDAASLMGSLNAAALLLRPFTIVRVRALLSVGSDQTAASENPAGAVGMLVVSDEARIAGASAIPDPVLDSGSPWFVWQPFNSSFVFGDATGFIESANSQYMIDSKAMRKVGTNEDVAIMAEEVNNVGATVQLTGRMLLKLH